MRKQNQWVSDRNYDFTNGSIYTLKRQLIGNNLLFDIEQVSSLINKLLSKTIEPTVVPDNPSSLFQTKSVPDRNPHILYVLETHSRTDRIALDIACKNNNLQLPDKHFSFGNTQFPTSVVYLKKQQSRLFKKRGFRPTNSFGKIIQIARNTATSTDHSNASDAPTNEQKNCLIVPVSVYWGQAPDKEDSFWKIYFSEYWELAGHTRKFFMCLIHGRNTLLRFSEPISLQEFINEQATSSVLERKLLRILRIHFRRRRRATLGPDLSHRRMLLQHVVNDPTVRTAITNESNINGKSVALLSENATDSANEIAADMSYRTVRLLHKVLKKLWNSLYDGVKLHGLNRLDAVVENAEIVYVPCHRSHIDYLLLSYILYVNGYSLPHIAAGINLNLPIVGGILRRGGAFFIRRSFAGDRIYSAVFNTYLKELLQRGYPLEYFVEGGRSRTGYLIPAKPGMLSMTIQAYLSDPQRPVYFVPVYFGYERLLEGRAFTHELAGKSKRRESLFGLIKALGVLRESYGNVHVNIGQPIALKSLLQRFALHNEPASPELYSSDRYRECVSSLGHEILAGINSATSVTPVSLVALVILSSPGKALARDDLMQQLEINYRLIQRLYAETLVQLPAFEPSEWMDRAQKLGHITQETQNGEEFLKATVRQTAPLNYFRNNIAHLYCMSSLIACALRQDYQKTFTDLEQLVSNMWPLFRAEYFLDEKDKLDAARNNIDAMLKVGLVYKNEDSSLQRTSAGSHTSVCFDRLARLLTPTLERYYLATSIITQLDSAVSKDTFQNEYKAAATRYAMTELREPATLYSKSYFEMLIESLENASLITFNNDKLEPEPGLNHLVTELQKLLPAALQHAVLVALKPTVIRLTNQANSA